MTVVAVDTSVVIPLLVASHEQHDRVRRWRSGRRIALAGHAAVESCSVLTRLPRDLRVGADDARGLLTVGFEPPLPAVAHALVDRLAAAEVTGGAVFDALVAMAAVDAGTPLASLDRRSIPTYARVGAVIERIR